MVRELVSVKPRHPMVDEIIGCRSRFVGKTGRSGVRPIRHLGHRGSSYNPVAAECVSMKVVILAGGRGSRLSEETDVKPKPMVEVGGRPLLWHIMQHYSRYGFNEFVRALGYRADYIKRYIIDSCQMHSDLTIKLGTGDILRHGDDFENDWTVQCVDTGLETQTGGRLKRLAHYLGDETFLMTYGDGVSDVN